MKLKCFIACAFGHIDVENKYAIIKSVLNSLNITALRVDKIDFNNKIDTKIIELIEECDFGIADLTYARPSVYYEAGRIHGLGREVIFTCRSDHFGGNEDHIKIHFDLLTHNIIPWTSNKEQFEKVLKRRIQKVIVPVHKANESKQKIIEEVRQFNNLSLIQKLTAIRAKTVETINNAKYDVLDLGKYEETVFAGRSGKKNKDDVVFGFINRSYTSNQIRDLFIYKIPFVVKGINRGFNDKRTKLDPTHTVILIISLSRMSEGTIQKALQHYSKIESPEKIYIQKVNEKIEQVIFLDSIKTLSEYQTRLNAVIS